MYIDYQINIPYHAIFVLTSIANNQRKPTRQKNYPDLWNALHTISVLSYSTIIIIVITLLLGFGQLHSRHSRILEPTFFMKYTCCPKPDLYAGFFIIRVELSCDNFACDTRDISDTIDKKFGKTNNFSH